MKQLKNYLTNPNTITFTVEFNYVNQPNFLSLLKFKLANVDRIADICQFIYVNLSDFL